MKTVIITIEKESMLNQLLDFVKKLKLKVRVTDSEVEFENEHSEWLALSKRNLTKIYGEDEPDYDLSMVKEPNPEYKKHK